MGTLLGLHPIVPWYRGRGWENAKDIFSNQKHLYYIYTYTYEKNAVFQKVL